MDGESTLCTGDALLAQDVGNICNSNLIFGKETSMSKPMRRPASPKSSIDTQDLAEIFVELGSIQGLFTGKVKDLLDSNDPMHNDMNAHALLEYDTHRFFNTDPDTLSAEEKVCSLSIRKSLTERINKKIGSLLPTLHKLRQTITGARVTGFSISGGFPAGLSVSINFEF